MHPERTQKTGKLPQFQQTQEERLEEVAGLARAIALKVLDTQIVNITRPSPGYLIGKGKREEIGILTEALEPDVVIVNHNLTPVQQRNLERQWQSKVIDRTGLILEIFGERAHTKEGKIQVDLAGLAYRRTRRAA